MGGGNISSQTVVYAELIGYVIKGDDMAWMGNYIDDYLRHLFKNLCLALIFRLQIVRE